MQYYLKNNPMKSYSDSFLKKVNSNETINIKEQKFYIFENKDSIKFTREIEHTPDKSTNLAACTEYFSVTVKKGLVTDYLYRLTFGKEKEDHYSLSESKVTLSSFDGEIKPRDGVDYVEVE